MQIIFNAARGFTLRPFMIIPKWATKTETLKASYTAHEQTHYQRQKNFFFAVWWVLRYFTSKKFRFEEEVLAYANEIRVLRKAGLNPSKDKYAKILSEEYWGACNQAEAFSALTAELALNG